MPTGSRLWSLTTRRARNARHATRERCGRGVGFTFPAGAGVADPGGLTPAGYHPRVPEHGALHRLVHEHLETFVAAALTPKPRVNLLLYHGVFAPHAARRRAAVAQAREVAEEPAESGSAAGFAAGLSSPQPRVASGPATAAEPAGAAAPRNHGWVRWAELLRRVFEIDVLHCARCGGRLRFVAAIDDPEVVRRILGHLGLPTSTAPPLPARSPPGPTQEPFDWA